jgi:hypothetical protein
MEKLKRRRVFDLTTDSRAGDAVLHADMGDGEHLKQIARDTVEFIESRFRSINADDPDAATKLLCGGCLSAILANLMTEMMAHTDHDLTTVAKFLSRHMDRTEESLVALAPHILFGKGDIKFSDPIPETPDA